MNSQPGLWIYGMRCTMLVYKNGLLKVRQTPCNSEVLINDLIATCDRLAKAY